MAPQSEEKTERDAGAGHVGALLQASRQRLGEDLPDVALMLRIRLPYMAAIEAGRYRDLPGATYAVGFIRAYAEHLGLDSEEVVRRFKAETIDGGADQKLSFPTPVPETGIPGGAYVFIGLVIAVLAYGTWYISTTEDGFFAELISPLDEQFTGLLQNNQTPQPASDADPEQESQAVTDSAAEPEVAQPMPRQPAAEEAPPESSLTEAPAPDAPAAPAADPAPAAAPELDPAVADVEPEPSAADVSADPSGPAPASARTEPAPESPAEQPSVAAEINAVPPSAPEVAATPSPAPADPSPRPATDTPAAASTNEPADTADAVVGAAGEPAPAAPPLEVAEAVSPAPSPPSSPQTEPEVAVEPAPSVADVTAPPAPVEEFTAPALVAEPAAQPEPESAAPAPPPVPAQAETDAEAEPDADAEVASTNPQAAGSSRIVINAKNNSWIQVRDDVANQMLVTRLLTAGDRYEVPDRPGLVLLTGNAGALEITVDGSTVPSIGGAGVVRRGVVLEADRLKAGTAVTN